MKKLFLIASAVALFASCQKSSECIQTISTYKNDGKSWVLVKEHTQTLSVDNGNNANVSDNNCLNGETYTDSTKTVFSTVCD